MFKEQFNRDLSFVFCLRTFGSNFPSIFGSVWSIICDGCISITVCVCVTVYLPIHTCESSATYCTNTILLFVNSIVLCVVMYFWYFDALIQEFQPSQSIISDGLINCFCDFMWTDHWPAIPKNFPFSMLIGRKSITIAISLSLTLFAVTIMLFELEIKFEFSTNWSHRISFGMRFTL